MNRRAFLIGIPLAAVAARATAQPGSIYPPPDCVVGACLSDGCGQTSMRSGMREFSFSDRWWPIGDGHHDEWIGGCVVDGRGVSIWERP